MSLPDILRAVRVDGDDLHARVPDGWRQGRTAYGGLSAALALHGVLRRDELLPPLRSVQIAFVGPVEADASVRPALLRRGRSASFWGADVCGATGLATRATFVFAQARPSHLALADDRAALHRAPDGAPAFPFPPAFARNFDYRFARPRPEAPVADLACWVRLKDRAGLDPFVELMCIGDALPPAALGVAATVGPLSSMTWQLNLHMAQPRTTDGWWLLRSTSGHAADGITTQRMGIWNADGGAVASGTQAVALFF